MPMLIFSLTLSNRYCSSIEAIIFHLYRFSIVTLLIPSEEAARYLRIPAGNDSF